MTTPHSKVALIGGGAIALETLEIFGAATFTTAYCEPSFAASARVDLPLCTDLQQLRTVASHYVLALADPRDRMRLAAALDGAGLLPAAPLVGPGSWISPSASVGPGSLLGHGVQIGPNCHIGPHNLILHHAVVGHDARSGRHVVLGPGVHVAGDTSIGDGVVVRANATLAKGIDVGAHALIAQSAACFRSVPAYATAIGNPARLLAPRPA
jgi:UDP-3-O-[3-hydroxymyristoyl] glucosamine N-acyltransferase